MEDALRLHVDGIGWLLRHEKKAQSMRAMPSN